MLAGLALLQGSMALDALRKRLISEGGLEQAFRESHAHVPRDEYTLALWRRVQPQVLAAAEQLGLQALPRLTPDEVSALDAVIGVQVPALRRRAGGARAGGTAAPPPARPDEQQSASASAAAGGGAASAAPKA